ncbi:hypothetical protein EUTSA_v10012766mg [Eutrema salsugineum]|uniref:Uncharacterized protein n=1 Tax=Eutrema salsugineum TaxID=72664 RepID=V4KT89_EUTSA|nr:subtilisin-like protease SBT3.11 [Eutrema salsugineum]ESQ41165.1 hypothetical protein EUTSA_v10012766mg [Eutrema salsugineum]
MGSQVSWWIFSVISLVLFLNVELSIVEGGTNEETKVYIVYMGERKHDDPELVTASHLDMLESLLGSKKAASEAMTHTYRHGFSGFAAHLTDSQVKKISEHPDVVSVTPNGHYEPQTTRMFDYLGLSQSIPKGLFHDAKMGEDVIIGVFDSGVWPESPMFSDKGLGPIPSRWKGHCEDGQEFEAKKHCNKKLIGARTYKPQVKISDSEYMSPRSKDGHGIHVASIAVGNFVPNVSDSGFGVGTVRGAAPKARLAIYKVCWIKEDGSCAFTDILKAMDDAIADGVDVMTLSIGRPIPVFNEVDEGNIIGYGAFHAISKGITVVACAGNTGPEGYSVLNIAPWIITVGATTIDRWYPTPLTLGNNETLMGRIPSRDKEVQAGLMYAMFARDITKESAMGKVVLAFIVKNGDAKNDYLTSATHAQARGVIFASRRNDVITFSEALIILEIDYEQGTTMLKYIQSTSSPTIKVGRSVRVTGPVIATKVAEFSGRGPNSVSPSVLKPDVVAPGVAILAASNPNIMGHEDGYFTETGTSMATPAVAGVVALLKAVHPDWSPAAIRSALITTASTTDPYGEPIFADGLSQRQANPFDYGGGLVSPNKAADPGLVYDADAEDYRRFLCASDYNEGIIAKLSQTTYKCPTTKPSVFELNLPSITIPFLKEDVTLTRTVTNVGPVDSLYKLVVEPPLGIKISVTPNTLQFNSSVKKLSYKVTVSTTHKANSIYYFGRLTWTDGSHNVTIPLSIRTEILKNFNF